MIKVVILFGILFGVCSQTSTAQTGQPQAGKKAVIQPVVTRPYTFRKFRLGLGLQLHGLTDQILPRTLFYQRTPSTLSGADLTVSNRALHYVGFLLWIRNEEWNHNRIGLCSLQDFKELKARAIHFMPVIHSRYRQQFLVLNMLL